MLLGHSPINMPLQQVNPTVLITDILKLGGNQFNMLLFSTVQSVESRI